MPIVYSIDVKLANSGHVYHLNFECYGFHLIVLMLAYTLSLHGVTVGCVTAEDAHVGFFFSCGQRSQCSGTVAVQIWIHYEYHYSTDNS